MFNEWFSYLAGVLNTPPIVDVILNARSANFLKSDSKDLSAEEANLKMKEYLVYHHNYKLKL